MNLVSLLITAAIVETHQHQENDALRVIIALIAVAVIVCGDLQRRPSPSADSRPPDDRGPRTERADLREPASRPTALSRSTTLGSRPVSGLRIVHSDRYTVKYRYRYLDTGPIGRWRSLTQATCVG
jgi:hypothetical protein